MLLDFLGSEWTQNQRLRDIADKAYQGSVGRWRRAIQHEPAIIGAWRAFEGNALSRGALEFLAEYDIEPIDAGSTGRGDG